MKDKYYQIYDKLLKLRKGNLEQRKVAIECEMILSDEDSKDGLDKKIEKIKHILAREEESR